MSFGKHGKSHGVVVSFSNEIEFQVAFQPRLLDFMVNIMLPFRITQHSIVITKSLWSTRGDCLWASNRIIIDLKANYHALVTYSIGFDHIKCIILQGDATWNILNEYFLSFEKFLFGIPFEFVCLMVGCIRIWMRVWRCSAICSS